MSEKRRRRKKGDHVASQESGISDTYLTNLIRSANPRFRGVSIPSEVLNIKRIQLQIKETLWSIKKGKPIIEDKKHTKMTPIPTYEVTNYETLNKFLLGTLSSIRRKEISLEEATAISQISDKIIKNNLTKIMDAKRMGSDEPINFFEPSEKQVMIG